MFFLQIILVAFDLPYGEPRISFGKATQKGSDVFAILVVVQRVFEWYPEYAKIFRVIECRLEVILSKTISAR
jgi:hypothetical protein